ncbi:MAG: CatB-related O-acetyltransferase [Bacteroidia bacterium]|nr:CatB-related O-acetyltransferase [Bacteroidia bacterium]MCF8445917.1 CatB-related O-acetyltransferase [Bacteroidia bacterium]
MELNIIKKYIKELVRPNSLIRIYRHYKQLKFFNNTSIKIGFDCKIQDSIFGNYVFVGNNCNVIKTQVGNYSYFNSNVKVVNAKIGKFCSIGSNVFIGVGEHPVNFVSTHPAFYSKSKEFKVFSDEEYFTENLSIEIGNDVWIGGNVTILNGVKIGTGSIIAYGAVVTKDVEPYSIVGGIPAKIIRYRFEKSEINFLMDSNWWDLPNNEFETNFKIFQDINLFKFYISGLQK